MADFALPATGVPEFDRDHRRFVLLIDEVRRQLAAGRRPMAVACGRQAFALLQSHVTREETFLRACGYPGLEEHRDAKGRLRDAALQLVRHLQQPDRPSLEVLQEAEAVAERALQCIRDCDGRYGMFLSRRHDLRAAAE